MTKENQENSSEQPNIDPFSLLTDTQWRYVTAMVEHPNFNKADGAKHINIKPDTVYKWGSHVGAAIEMGRRNVHEAALARRRQAVLKAIAVKVALLDSDDEAVRSKAATEIIEWELGKAMQPTDVTTGGDKLKFEIAYVNRDGNDSD